MTPPSQSYKAGARLLHWSMAILVIAMVPVGFLMIQKGLDRSLQNNLFIFHKNVGVLLLILIVIRIIYRWRNAPPPEPTHLATWQLKVAGATHWSLYTLLFVMPVAGYVRVRAGGFPIEALDAMGVPALVPKSKELAALAKSVHFYGGWAIAILMAMHIAAALQHGLIKRDGVFSRMWPTKP
ncbi:cytochrome b [uncultured Roseobacter sp.]|uniref:cytochrome b n=1 Tax=uncultured Roseobacter sp. TaxID=114847 RepID=UPI002624E71B|nr:cytochrome b [uncultured Roseobacter sp.]